MLSYIHRLQYVPIHTCTNTYPRKKPFQFKASSEFSIVFAFVQSSVHVVKMAPKMAPKVAPSKETLVAAQAWAMKLEPDASDIDNSADLFTGFADGDDFPEAGGVAKKPAGKGAKSMKAMKAVKVMKAMPAKKSMKAMKAMKAMKVMKAMKAMKATTSVEEDIGEEVDKEEGAEDTLDNGEGAEEEEGAEDTLDNVLDASPKKKARAKRGAEKTCWDETGGSA